MTPKLPARHSALMLCPTCGMQVYARGLAQHEGRKVCRTVARVKARRAAAAAAEAR